MKLIYTEEFKKAVKKVKDNKVQSRIKKTIQKIEKNPTVGKPLKYEFSGLRSVKIPPFRIIYELKGDSIILHRFEHRNKVY
ncbi:MAG TPA: type II toxin-antitoxin system RelE/ParE family toxin [Methanosarcinales archaeon]|nr:type II toxin-antitoxin system RelE/ParE family toxin [Methanosarcinales archaeon]